MPQQFSAQLPNRESAVVNQEQLATPAWYNFFAFLASLTAREAQGVSVGASPYVYEATSIGHLHVAAGTVTSIVLQRGSLSLPCPTSGFTPVVAGDFVTIDYTVAPTVTFLPGARA